MKKLILPLFIAAFVYGCSGNKTEEHSHDGSEPHSHEDGSHHHDDAGSGNKQEEFTVGQDSAKADTAGHHDHSHDGHDHGHDHKH